MDLIFITECRFYKTQSGKYYADDMSYNNELWKRYLNNFEKVNVIARVFESNEVFDESLLVDTVNFLPIIGFDNIGSFLKNLSVVRKQIKKYLDSSSVTIVRGAGPLGYISSVLCRKNNIKYGIEVIGDPYDVYAPGVIQHPLRPILRKLFTYFQVNAVKHADAVIYVTKHSLQRRYPASKKAFSTFASDVFIDSSNLLKAPRKFKVGKIINLISIGSLNQMYKSPDILIKAVKILSERGIESSLTWLGDGKYMNQMKDLVAELNINENVEFAGSVSAIEVRKHLDNSDIFLLVSRTEGLPRAVVEAMARALPCIGTNVGGIPELLDSSVLVETESPEAIAEKIEYFLNNNDFVESQSKINLENANDYSFDKLDSKRKEFYNYLKLKHAQN